MLSRTARLSSMDHSFSNIERFLELLETMASPVDEFSSSLQVVPCKGLADLRFFAFQKTREQFAGDVGVVCQFRVSDQLVPQADGCAVELIIEASSKLDITTTSEIFAIRRALITQVSPVII